MLKRDQKWLSTHVQVVILQYFDPEGLVEDIIHTLQTVSEGYEDCKIVDHGWDAPLYEVVGWRECTPEELEARAKAREADKKARAKAKAKLEEAELAQLAKLKAKYEKNG